MPGILSKPADKHNTTELHFAFDAETVALSLPTDTFLSFDVPRDAEGKRFSTKQFNEEVAEVLKPYGLGPNWCQKVNLGLLSMLSSGGDFCSVDQLKAIVIWMCAVFAIDDVFDGKRFEEQSTLLAIVEAILPKYDDTGIPNELLARTSQPLARMIVDTTNSIRRNIVYPQLRTRRHQFDQAFELYMQGVADELLGSDATCDEAEYLRIRFKDAGEAQFLEMYWDFHGAIDDEIQAVERVSFLGQLMVGIDNDIVSHKKTVKERGGEPVHDFVTVNGGSLSAARLRRNMLYAEYCRELEPVRDNRAVKGIVDWVSANLLFSASSRRYLKTPLNVRHFFTPEVADWLVAEGFIA